MENYGQNNFGCGLLKDEPRNISILSEFEVKSHLLRNILSFDYDSMTNSTPHSPFY